MRKITILIFLLLGMKVLPQNAAITIIPPDATAFDQLTLYLDASKSCPAGALFNADSVMMHSGITLNGQPWQRIIAYNQVGYNGQRPKLVKYNPPVYAARIEPPTATAWDEVTLILDANLSCPTGALLNADSVMMHSGVTINGAIWQNIVPYNGVGANGQRPKLTHHGNGIWKMTFVPAEFYGIPQGAKVTAINCVFNAGSWAAGEGKAFDQNGNCVDFVIPFQGPPVGDHIWMITFVPAQFYGVEPGNNVISHIDCVFNAGSWAAGEGKDYAPDGSCKDFKIPLRIPTQQTARVKVIHNSADAAASAVDVWLNNTKLIDNFAFRTSTPFVDAPAGTPITIAIKEPGSTNPNNPIYSQTLTLDASKKYILVANGIVSTSGYNPVKPFQLYVCDIARETASSTDKVDILVFHGSTDAPIVDVYEVSDGANLLADNLDYGNFAGYLEVLPGNYSLQIRDQAGTSEVATFAAPLVGMAGKAITVLASGFLVPGNNSNGPAFGLYVATADGGPLIELQKTSSVTQLEVPDVKIYPNPVRDLLSIEADQDIRKVEIFNALGKQIMVQSDQSRSIVIPTRGWASGIYLLRLHTEQEILTLRVLKE